jgi:hypothetical protein
MRHPFQLYQTHWNLKKKLADGEEKKNQDPQNYWKKKLKYKLEIQSSKKKKPKLE